MLRASNAFSLLQAIAAIVGLAIILWSLGLPSLRFAEAANVISFSDTLSDSSPSASSNHTISFVTPSGLSAGDTITLNFEAGEFGGITSLTEEDFDLAINGSDEDLGAAASGPTWGVTAAGDTITIDSGTATIGAGATVTIEIGTNATHQVTGDSQIANPAAATSYEIGLVFGTLNDTGTTRVAIVDNVTVTASVDTIFSFSVGGVVGGTTVNTSSNDSTTGDTTATTIPFGTLVADTASTAAQSLEVSTNAANGFVVTVQTDQQLLSANGADIDGFIDGDFTNTATLWQQPGASPTAENSYGHWGLSSTDTSLTAGLNDFFGGGNEFVSASTTPVEVFRHDGPTDGSLAHQGNTTVIYQVEISALQEAATDYTATLTYVATPVF